MTEKDVAKAIYMAWMADERWARLDIAAAAGNIPAAYFWAEIAARAALLAAANESAKVGAVLK